MRLLASCSDARSDDAAQFFLGTVTAIVSARKADESDGTFDGVVME